MSGLIKTIKDLQLFGMQFPKIPTAGTYRKTLSTLIQIHQEAFKVNLAEDFSAITRFSLLVSKVT